MKNKFGNNIVLFFSCKVIILIIVLMIYIGGVPLNGQALTVTISDINPNSSNRDATNPNAASGGRVNGLAADPSSNQVFYAASEWGGLFKSVDGGNNWSRLDGHLPHVTWDVAVDPNDSNRIYVTSFFDGRVFSQSGINVSTDGGQTWAHPPTAAPPPNFCANAGRRSELSAFGISVDPNNSNNVYIGTNCGLAFSNDQGVTWSFVDPTPADGADNVWDVVVHNGGIIDLCGNDGHQRSIDGGVTWTTAIGFPRPGGGRCSIDVSPDESYVIFLVSGTTIFESDDGGTTWSTFINPGPQGRIPFVSVNDRSGAAFDLWFADTQLYRAGCTTPSPAAIGGASRCPASNNWTLSQIGAHWDGGDIEFDSQVAVDSCPMLYSNDGGVYLETQGTSPNCHTPTWEQPTITPHALWQFGLTGANTSGDEQEELYFGNQDTGTFASTDAGSASPTWNNRDCCDGFDLAAAPGQVVYTVCCYNAGRRNRVFVSGAGMVGGNELATYPPAGNVPGFRTMDSIANYGANSYAMVTTAGVYITNNITANPVVWTQLGATTSPPQTCGIQSATTGGTRTFFVKSGGCEGETGGSLWSYTGTAAGGAWQRIARNGNSTFGIFAVDPRNPNRIFASDLVPATGPAMVITNDGGASWNTMPALDQLMTGNGTFAYQNQEGPTNFTGLNGYPQPRLVGIDPEQSNIMVAAGADSGVFVTLNGGTTWDLVTDPNFPQVTGTPHISRAHHVHFEHPDISHVNIYLGTKGRGAWRLNVYTGFIVPPKFCKRFPKACGVLELDRNLFKLKCLLSECFIVDSFIPKNCLLKWSCPGCGPGQLCPPYYHIYIDDVKDHWRVGIFDMVGKPVKHQLHKTPKGVVLSFRPDKDKYVEGRIGNYVLGFKMTRKGKPGVTYNLPTRIKRSNKPYRKSQKGKMVLP